MLFFSFPSFFSFFPRSFFFSFPFSSLVLFLSLSDSKRLPLLALFDWSGCNMISLGLFSKNRLDNNGVINYWKVQVLPKIRGSLAQNISLFMLSYFLPHRRKDWMLTFCALYLRTGMSRQGQNPGRSPQSGS